jgi:hypothetical protein
MTDAAQRISVILEHDDEDDQWTVVSVLIGDKGARRLTTLARFLNRTEAAGMLETIYASLPIQMGEGEKGS